MNIYFHQFDLPNDLDLGKSVAIDTEAMGLNPHRDDLCLVQLSTGNGDCHLVQMNRKTFDAPNLAQLLHDASVEKIFHFARFDVMMLIKYFEHVSGPIFCTKIASKLIRTYTQRHGLKDLCRDLLGVEISKEQQTSDWGAEALSPEQQQYAATDVLHLHALKEKLVPILNREGRTGIASECFQFLPTRCHLDLLGFEDPDIFSHKS